jgi:hypothetical protein
MVAFVGALLRPLHALKSYCFSCLLMLLSIIPSFQMNVKSAFLNGPLKRWNMLLKPQVLKKHTISTMCIYSVRP